LTLFFFFFLAFPVTVQIFLAGCPFPLTSEDGSHVPALFTYSFSITLSPLWFLFTWRIVPKDWFPPGPLIPQFLFPPGTTILPPFGHPAPQGGTCYGTPNLSFFFFPPDPTITVALSPVPLFFWYPLFPVFCWSFPVPRPSTHSTSSFRPNRSTPS